MSNGSQITQGAPLCNKAVKQVSMKNGDRENSESVSGSKTEFRIRKFRMYIKKVGFPENGETRQACRRHGTPLKTQYLKNETPHR